MRACVESLDDPFKHCEAERDQIVASSFKYH